MLGHLKPSLCSLGTENKVAYRTLYCSVCASLRSQYSLPYSLFINNELTLVLLALQPYYEGEMTAKETPCPAAAFTQKNPAATHPAIDIAAKLSVLLGWIKVVDWETDEPKFYKKYLRKILDRKVQQTLPEISKDFRQVIEEYLFLTKTNATNEQQVRHYSGLLSQHVVLEVGKQTAIEESALKELTALFEMSGEVIAIADHLMDLDEDMLQNQYNPIVFRSEQEKISLSEAYYYYLQICNRIKIGCLEQLKVLEEKGIIAKPFKVAMLQSFRNIDRQIQRKRPAFLANVQEYISMEGLQVARQDCGSTAMEGCNCATQQGELETHYIAGQCPCGQCCDACGGCCKGGGECCGGCGDGCGKCCGNYNNCCNGCNSSCGSCGKSCDDCCGGCNSCCDSCNDCFGICDNNCCRTCNDCTSCDCCDNSPSTTPPEGYEPNIPATTDTIQVTQMEFRQIIQKIEGKTSQDILEWKNVFDSLQQYDPAALRPVFDHLQSMNEVSVEEMNDLMDGLRK